jgi:hypothetical protein
MRLWVKGIANSFLNCPMGVQIPPGAPQPSGGMEYTLVLETSAFGYESSNLSSATKLEKVSYGEV